MSPSKMFFHLVLLISITAGLVSAQLDVKIESAVLTCSGSDSEIQVTFDRSLNGLLLDAHEKMAKAGSVASQTYFRGRLENLKSQIEALSPEPSTISDDEGMTTIYLLTLTGQRIGIKPIRGLTVSDLETGPKLDDVYDTISYVPTKVLKRSDKFLFMLASASKNPSMVSLLVSKKCEEVPEKLPDPTYQPDYRPSRPYSEIVAAVNAKDEAMVFADFAFDSRKKNNADDANTHSFTANLTFVPKRIRKIGFAGTYEIQPFFYELKVNDKGDENSYISNFGSRVRHIRVFGDDGHGFNNERNNRFLPGLVTDLTARLEMNDFFDGINLVGEIKPVLPINVYQSRARLLRFEPFIGYTFGRKLKESSRSESQIPRGTLSRLDWINRPMAGFELTYSEFRDRVIKPTLTMGYTVRWPLQAEDFYAKSADGNNKDIFLGQSRLPRNYYTGRVSLDFGTIVTPFIGYESGRLPPDYKLISGQIKVGLSVKFKKN